MISTSHPSPIFFGLTFKRILFLEPSPIFCFVNQFDEIHKTNHHRSCVGREAIWQMYAWRSTKLAIPWYIQAIRLI
jgi:hypothetical protein